MCGLFSCCDNTRYVPLFEISALCVSCNHLDILMCVTEQALCMKFKTKYSCSDYCLLSCYSITNL